MAQNSVTKFAKLKAVAAAVNHHAESRLTAVRAGRHGHPIQGFGQAVVNFAYPPTCVLCGAPGRGALDLCAGCHADLPQLAPSCPRCARPWPIETSMGLPCGDCQHNPPAYERCVALFRYQDVVVHLISALKFHQRLALARLFGQLLAEAALQHAGGFWPDLLLPVPLHPARLRQRGYNQSLEVARVLGRWLDVGVAARWVTKVVATAPQQSLGRAERVENVRGVFYLRRPLTARRVAIIDDVMTTGATVNELARLLRASGAERVQAWVIARTP